jgi:ABC-type branched-subunit amino acid transport system ATPase component
MLELIHVSKSFGGLTALSDVSFHINEGEIVGLIGPNGSGKSTAFNVITGFLPATSGKILFQGEDITGKTANQVAKLGMARSFQMVRPFMHLTAWENVEAGCLFSNKKAPSRRAARTRAYEILEQVGLAAKADVEAVHLTIIERKWLEIARSLAGNPRLLLLDEFMAGLSVGEIPRALDLIRSLNTSGITIIIVEHIIKTITSTCQRVIVLNAGMKLAEGTPAEVIRNPEVIEAYLGRRHAHSQ